MYKASILNAPILLIPSRFDWRSKETAGFLSGILLNAERQSAHRIIKVIRRILRGEIL